MRTIYELDQNGIATGASRVIGDMEGRPSNWVVSNVPPPEGIAQWQGQWVILDSMPAVPSLINSVSMRQIRLELLSQELLDDVTLAVEQSGIAAQIEWEYATSVDRNNPLVAAIQQILQYTDEQVDDLFIKAAKR